MSPLVIAASITVLGWLAHKLTAAIRRRLQIRDHAIAQRTAYDLGFDEGGANYAAGKPAPHFTGDLVDFNPALPASQREHCRRFSILSHQDAGRHDGWWQAARADLTPAGITRMVQETQA